MTSRGADLLVGHVRLLEQMWLRLTGGETWGTSGKLVLLFQGLDGVLGRTVNDSG